MEDLLDYPNTRLSLKIIVFQGGNVNFLDKLGNFGIKLEEVTTQSQPRVKRKTIYSVSIILL